MRTERNLLAGNPDSTEQASLSDDDEVTDEQIAARAYEISQSEDAGNDEENWTRAERELHSAQDATAGG